MAKSGVRIKGRKKLIANLKEVAQRYPKIAGAALFEEADVDLRGIVIPLTPLDRGPLRGSFFVNTPLPTTRGPKVTVGFGGAAAAYALAQHEGPRGPHAPASWDSVAQLKYTEAGTGSKFLERAVIELSTGHLQRLRKSMATKVARIKLRK